ncbi:hypothetical protein, partial [Nocardia amamiensis]|uniref:hypothetical protein n=1 Tax=Nocardia amamiensis TaxID=404578 RepID=UPI001C3F76C3
SLLRLTRHRLTRHRLTRLALTRLALTRHTRLTRNTLLPSGTWLVRLPRTRCAIRLTRSRRRSTRLPGRHRPGPAARIPRAIRPRRHRNRRRLDVFARLDLWLYSGRWHRVVVTSRCR